jgi:hypothetical protein
MPDDLPMLLALSALLPWIVLACLRAFFWRVRFPPEPPEPASWPAVVAVVPARDEAGVIEASLGSLLRQDCPGDWHLVLAMLRYYARSPLWAPLLPLVALFYLGATLASAWRYRQGRGGQWKGRIQAAPQSR